MSIIEMQTTIGPSMVRTIPKPRPLLGHRVRIIPHEQVKAELLGNGD